MKQTIVKTKDEARQKAIDWQSWQADKNLSYSELISWSNYFERLAIQFDLTLEFMENAII